MVYQLNESSYEISSYMVFGILYDKLHRDMIQWGRYWTDQLPASFFSSALLILNWLGIQLKNNQYLEQGYLKLDEWMVMMKKLNVRNVHLRDS